MVDHTVVLALAHALRRLSDEITLEITTILIEMNVEMTVEETVPETLVASGPSLQVREPGKPAIRSPHNQTEIMWAAVIDRLREVPREIVIMLRPL